MTWITAIRCLRTSVSCVACGVRPPDMRDVHFARRGETL
jgi:hypothetical protein